MCRIHDGRISTEGVWGEGRGSMGSRDRACAVSCSTVNIEYTSFEYFNEPKKTRSCFFTFGCVFSTGPDGYSRSILGCQPFFSCVCTLHFSRSTERTGAICIFSFEGGPRLSKGNTVVHNVARVRHEVLRPDIHNPPGRNLRGRRMCCHPCTHAGRSRTVSPGARTGTPVRARI